MTDAESTPAPKLRWLVMFRPWDTEPGHEDADDIVVEASDIDAACDMVRESHPDMMIEAACRLYANGRTVPWG